VEIKKFETEKPVTFAIVHDKVELPPCAIDAGFAESVHIGGTIVTVTVLVTVVDVIGGSKSLQVMV
jgi:hypothetical protein